MNKHRNIAIDDLETNPWGPEDEAYGLSGRAAQEEYWLRSFKTFNNSDSRNLAELEKYIWAKKGPSRENARNWIANLLASNGFGDDYTNADLDAWADDLFETLGLNV